MTLSSPPRISGVFLTLVLVLINLSRDASGQAAEPPLRNTVPPPVRPIPSIAPAPPANPVKVDATKVQPDRVATSLMPVPIYEFAVHNVAFSPDSRTLATGNGAGAVKLWDTDTGALRISIQAHTNWAFSVAWSHDGTFFVSGGGDDLIHRFTAASPAQPAQTFTGHRNDVHGVALTPDDKRIVSAGDDRKILIWNIESGSVEKTLTGHTLPIPSVTISPSGEIIASGSRDNSIRLWKLSTGELLDTLIGHSEDVMSVKFSPSGKFLASASYDKTARLWDVNSGKALRIFKGHTNRVFSVAFSPDGAQLATAGDSTVRIWETQSGNILRQISLGGSIVTSQQGQVPENISSVAYSPNGKWLAAASTTGQAFLLSAQTGEIVLTFASKP